MKTTFFIFLISVFGFITHVFAGNPNDTTYVKTEHYEGIIFGKNYPQNHSGIDTNKRWNPTIEDIAIAEEVIRDYFEEVCRKYKNEWVGYNPNFCEHAGDYIRQYIGEKDAEKRTLYILSLWKEYIADYCPEWKVNRFSILGGGTACWYMLIDMDKREVVEFYTERL